ncbi:hypothetical protein C1O66_13825 [Paucibacter aquatile]|uniref:Uncharacterized protein n=1 Tax=Kinneretia aquatilis TaxID=2070761 RepID=A0A2N8KYF6_9BURK|nr:hypothetical protein [Paucibacter aquatile]PND38493.1 hypothetical protein C1O66_13825 [Paucibacter aquatile]
MSTQHFQTRFKTLLQREWMQHHKGWLIAMLALPLIALLALPFGGVQIGEAKDLPPTESVGAIMAATMLAVWGITLLMTGFSLPGLARRDHQDRSIEFWLSLPASHSESLIATLFMHTIFVLVLALGVGLCVGVVMALAITLKLGGFVVWTQVSWYQLVLPALAVLARMVLGTVLFTLWMAPIFMSFMVAAAWLKRWGVPAVVTAVVTVGVILHKVYLNPIVWTLLAEQVQGAGSAFFDAMHLIGEEEAAKIEIRGVADVLNWAGQDAAAALAQTASPHFVGGLVVAAICFGLLILHRRNSH